MLWFQTSLGIFLPNTPVVFISAEPNKKKQEKARLHV